MEPFEAAGVAFVAGDRVLMLKRPDGVWGLPFGKVELGETTIVAAMRETFEEIGYVITEPLTFLYRNVIGEVTSTCYLCKCKPFVPLLNEEHTEFVWAPITDIPQPTFPAIVAALNGETVAMDRADSAREFDVNGWMEVDANPLSKVGVYQYLGKNIKGAPDPDAFYGVYRPAEELADPECIASFRLVPWIDDHAMLGEGEKLTRPEDKGIEGVIGERVFFDAADGDGVLKGNIKVFTSRHTQTVDEGKRELSVGYRCRYEYAPGEFKGVPYTYVQRKLRGNHLASVEDGRMGPDVAVMDGQDGLSFTIDSKEFVKMAKPKTPVVKTNKVSNLMGQLIHFATDASEEETKDVPAGEMKQLQDLLKQAAPLMEQIAALQSVLTGAATPDPVDNDTPVIDSSTGKVEEGQPTSDEDDKGKEKEDKAMDGNEIKQLVKLVGVLTKEVAALKSQPTFDASDVLREIKQRDTLAEDLSFHVGTFDHSEMSHQQVAAYGVEKLGIPGVEKGHEVAAVSAFLHGRAKPTPPSRRQGAQRNEQNAMDAGDKDGAAAFLNEITNGTQA